MPEAQFDIEIKRRTHIFSLDEDLAERLTAIARAKRMPSKTLINEWLREKVVEQAKATP
jgi:predicted transcriptional regulator